MAIDERLLASESEAQIDENFNRVLALIDTPVNRKETYVGTAENLWDIKEWGISEWDNFIRDVIAGNISVVVQLDSSSTGDGTTLIKTTGVDDPMDGAFLVGQVADIRGASSINAMTIMWHANDCIAAKTVMNGTYQDMTQVASLFPTITTVYYHPMPETED